MTNILEIEKLSKRFSDNIAVDDITFNVKQGICFGLLGPNGAGKTTTIEMMEGILKPTSGEIKYSGKAIDELYRQEVGIQFQHTAIQDFLTVKETLEMFANFYPDCKAGDATKFADEIVAKAAQVSPAAIQGYFMFYKHSASDALKNSFRLYEKENTK